MTSPFSPFQKLFVYDRREIVLLTTLSLVIGLFTFTLGVHLGKEVDVKIESTEKVEAKLVNTIPDQIPSNQALVSPNKITQIELEESLNQTLHDEVVRTGIRLNPTYQTELPEHAKTHNAGATSLLKQSKSVTEKTHLEEAAQNEQTAQVTSRKISSVAEPKQGSETEKSQYEADSFKLQIGSFPKRDEAEKKLTELTHLDLKPFIREIDLAGKGKWFRIYLGSFATKLAAEKAGNTYVAQHKIQSFIVSKLAE